MESPSSIQERLSSVQERLRQQQLIDGGPAFPNANNDIQFGGNDGMMLRDYFAAAALTGLLGSPGAQPEPNDTHETASKKFAIASYRLADAMIEERNNT